MILLHMHSAVGTVDGRSYNGQQKYTICDACRLITPLNSKHTEANFFTKFSEFIALSYNLISSLDLQI